MPISPALGEVFSAAKRLHSELQSSKVEPLHLLAGVLSLEEVSASTILEETGITKEAVIAAIREER